MRLDEAPPGWQDPCGPEEKVMSEAELIDLENKLDKFQVAAGKAEHEGRVARIAPKTIETLCELVRVLIEEARAEPEQEIADL